MQLGMIGLGRMGAGMVRRLMRGGHSCVVFDLNPANVAELTAAGAGGFESLSEFVVALDTPRAVWVMLPAGDPTEQTVNSLAALLEPGDIVIDGGNTLYKDDVRRAHLLAAKGVAYVDVGTSGGVWGSERGYCLTIGGPARTVQHLEPIFRALAPGRGDVTRTPGRAGAAADTAEEGYLHCGPTGAGHFVKMVHNGIEYGLMQAYAEGFDLLRQAAGGEIPEQYRYVLDTPAIAEVWRRGSVVGSWLLDLLAAALRENPRLDGFTGSVQDSGEGRWAVEAALERGVPAPVLSSALHARFRSRQDHPDADKLLSAMRREFGGHVEKSSRQD